MNMHSRIKHYRDRFYQKMINYGRFNGTKYLFLSEKDFDYITKNDLKTRIIAETGVEFEINYLKQLEKSEITGVIDTLLQEADIDRFDTSYTTLCKSDIEKLTQFDIDILKLELNILKPKNIIVFSKKLGESISKLVEVKSTKITSVQLPLVYSSDFITNVSKEIRTLAA